MEIDDTERKAAVLCYSIRFIRKLNTSHFEHLPKQNETSVLVLVNVDWGVHFTALSRSSSVLDEQFLSVYIQYIYIYYAFIDANSCHFCVNTNNDLVVCALACECVCASLLACLCVRLYFICLWFDRFSTRRDCVSVIVARVFIANNLSFYGKHEDAQSSARTLYISTPLYLSIHNRLRPRKHTFFLLCVYRYVNSYMAYIKIRLTERYWNLHRKRTFRRNSHVNLHYKQYPIFVFVFAIFPQFLLLLFQHNKSICGLCERSKNGQKRLQMNNSLRHPLLRKFRRK